MLEKCDNKRMQSAAAEEKVRIVAPQLHTKSNSTKRRITVKGGGGGRTLVALELLACGVVVEVDPHVLAAGRKAPLGRAEAGRLHGPVLVECLHRLQRRAVPEAHLGARTESAVQTHIVCRSDAYLYISAVAVR